MRVFLGFVAFAVPMAFLPGWSFYYDVTPKVVALLFGCAAVCLWSTIRPMTIETSATACWNAWLAAGFAASIIVAAISSPGEGVWIGSNWRRYGAVVQLAAVVMGVVVGQFSAQRPRVRSAVLRGFCAAGLLASGYAIAQYFGWDPFLDLRLYRFGEGEYQIVRPPGILSAIRSR